MESIANQIMKIRVKKDISKADMARACGITQTAYSNIEDEKTKSISIEVGKKIATALGISFNELFEIDGESMVVNSLKSEIENLKSVSIELKERIAEKDLVIKSIEKTNRHLTSRLTSIFDTDILRETSEFEFKLRDCKYEGERQELATNLAHYLDDTFKKYEFFIFCGALDQVDISKFTEYKKEIIRKFPEFYCFQDIIREIEVK